MSGVQGEQGMDVDLTAVHLSKMNSIRIPGHRE
jgi:hypothetical protein